MYSCSSNWADIKETFMASAADFLPRMQLFLLCFFRWLCCLFQPQSFSCVFTGFLVLKPQFSLQYIHILVYTMNFNFIMIVVALTENMGTPAKYPTASYPTGSIVLCLVS